MIKFTATAEDGAKLVGFGLSHRNLELLKQDKPIAIKLREMLPDLGRDIDILIFAGESEYDITEKLAGLIGPETRIVSDERPEQPRER